MAKDATPIDLTASLLKAKYWETKHKPCSVEWVVETLASPANNHELHYVASLFKEIDVKVVQQKDIPELNPNKSDQLLLLEEILQYIDTSKGMVRIQHGAIILERGNVFIPCRYFGWKNEKLLLCTNKKNPTFYYVDKDDPQKIFFQGSMNLCLIQKYGEFAHLPWYCLDSNIFPFEVEEIITPPEGCSNARFDIRETRLIPSGYSIYDYSLEKNKTLSVIEQWLYENGSVISSRQKGGTRCAKNLLLKIARNIKNSIKSRGFYAALFSIRNNVDTPEELIIRLIEIWALSQIMISFDRGFFDEIRNTGLINNNNELEIARGDILNILVGELDICSRKIALYDKSLANLIFGRNKPFGILANVAKKLVVQYFNQLFYEFYYLNKATLPNLLRCYSTDMADINFLDVLINERSTDIMHMVRGSIFEFEAFTSIASRMVKSGGNDAR